MKKLVLLGLVLTCVVSGAFAVKTSEIEAVRSRTDGSSSELNASDRGVIEAFWENALNTMQLTEEVQEIVDIRRQVEAHKSAQPLSSYASAYIEAAAKYLPLAFTHVAGVSDTARRQLIEQNLMILTAMLESPKLATIAIDRMGQDDPVVRYWAVKAVTNPGVVQSLSNSITADEDAKAAILNALKKRLAVESQPAIQAMITQFVATVDHATAREILLATADRRIAAYKNWTVQNEIMDAKLLIALGSTAMMQSDAEVKKVFGRKFAELYSLTFQRNMLGQDTLSDQQIEQNNSVIVEVDQVVLAKMLNVAKTGVKEDIRRGQLKRIHETLFGDRMREGDLARLYKFDYGKDAGGKAITEPPKLSAPPVKATEDNG